MCSHYQAVRDLELYRRRFHVYPPADPGKSDVWPGYLAPAIRRSPHLDAGDEAVPPMESFLGRFGLVPHWAKDPNVRGTFNARSETVAAKPSFRDAWRHGQRCIIPADAIYEPDWRSGKAVATRITSSDGTPMGIAGLWSSWSGPEGQVLGSFTMLTINADSHALMKNFHKPDDEKRMVVVLDEDSYDAWLATTVARATEFMTQYPAEKLKASTVV